MNPIKKCTRCKKEKSLKDFPCTVRWVQGESKEYFNKMCKHCTAINTKGRKRREAGQYGKMHEKEFPPIDPKFLVRGKIDYQGYWPHAL